MSRSGGEFGARGEVAALRADRIYFVVMNRIVARGVKAVRRVVIGVVGMTVLLGGIALLVLPGPAFLVIPAGIGILALEFAWARNWLARAREYYPAGTEPKKDDRSEP